MKIALAWSAGSAAALLIIDQLVIKGNPMLNQFYLDFILFAIVAALIPIGIFDHFNRTWVKNIEDQLPEVLRIVAQSQKTGSTLPRAFEEASKRTSGTLAAELRRALTKMSWGVSFEDALMSFSKRVNTLLVRRTVSLIIECYKIGGNITQVIEQTENYTRELHSLSEDRYSQTRPYTIVIYIGVILFLVSTYMLLKSFLIPLSEVAGNGAGTLSGLGAFSVADFRQALFIMVIVQVTLAGLVAGKISEGSVMAGIKHSVILLILACISFMFI